DFVLFTSAFALAYVLRFRGLATANQRTLFTDALPVIIAARYAVFILFGRYTSLWRSVGMRDALRTIAAVVLSEAIAVGLLAMSDATKFATFSRSVFVLDAAICAAFVIASRVVARWVARTWPSLRRDERRPAVSADAGSSRRA